MLDCSLIIGWREELPNPERGVLTFSEFVCVCVCVCACVYMWATEHSFSPKNLIFGLSDPWDMRQKLNFLFLEILIFTIFMSIFRYFPYKQREFTNRQYRRRCLFHRELSPVLPISKFPQLLCLSSTLFWIDRTVIYFPYITLVNFCFQATGHSFSPRDMIFGLRGPFNIRK